MHFRLRTSTEFLDYATAADNETWRRLTIAVSIYHRQGNKGWLPGSLAYLVDLVNDHEAWALLRKLINRKRRAARRSRASARRYNPHGVPQKVHKTS